MRHHGRPEYDEPTMTPEQYCEEKAARSGSSFYYSFLFLNPAQRRAIIALYAYCRVVDDVVDECREESVARIKLQWWREEVGRLYAGQARHPVTRALAPSLARFALKKEHMLAVIDGMEMDLEQVRYADFEALAVYCYRAAAVVGLMSAQIFGYEDASTLKYAHDLGLAFQLTNILRDVREDAARGRIYLPQDELARFGVSETDILNYRQTPELQALLRFQAERARGYYTRAFEQLPEVDRGAQRAGIIMARIYLETLDVLEQDGLRVMEHRVLLTPLRKLWLAWQTAWRERRRHRRWRAAQQRA